MALFCSFNDFNGWGKVFINVLYDHNSDVMTFIPNEKVPLVNEYLVNNNNLIMIIFNYK